MARLTKYVLQWTQSWIISTQGESYDIFSFVSIPFMLLIFINKAIQHNLYIISYIKTQLIFDMWVFKAFTAVKIRSVLLRCSTASLGDWCPNVLRQHSGLKMLGTDHPAMQHHTPEEGRPRPSYVLLHKVVTFRRELWSTYELYASWEASTLSSMTINQHHYFPHQTKNIQFYALVTENLVYIHINNKISALSYALNSN